MNANRAERVVQVISVPGVWMAFLVGWGYKAVQEKSLAAHGADLPMPTLLWIDFADSWLALAFPAACTVLIVWLVRRASIHLNWVAGAVLFISMLYGVIAQTATILPSFKMCGAV